MNLEIHQKDNIISRKKRSLGQWLCADETIIAQFRNNLALHVKNKKIKELLPSVEGLATLVNENSVLRMNFTLAIELASANGQSFFKVVQFIRPI